MFYLVRTASAGLLALIVTVQAHAQAQTIGGFEFPNGTTSFADVIVEYDPDFSGGPGPSDPHSDPGMALGVPDTGRAVVCADPGPPCPYVSLGHGGRLIVQFTDNVLSGGGDDGIDLVVFEVGAQVEGTFVDLSTNGIDWVPVGKIEGSTIGIDLDAIGIGLGDNFTYVRLTDDTDPAEGGVFGDTVGADIDAIGAISPPPIEPPEPGPIDVEPVPVPVPAPFIALLALLVGLIGLVSFGRSGRKHKLDR